MGWGGVGVFTQGRIKIVEKIKKQNGNKTSGNGINSGIRHRSFSPVKHSEVQHSQSGLGGWPQLTAQQAPLQHLHSIGSHYLNHVHEPNTCARETLALSFSVYKKPAPGLHLVEEGRTAATKKKDTRRNFVAPCPSGCTGSKGWREARFS